LKIWINAKYGQINDSKKLARDVSKIGHRGYGDYELNIENDNDLEYVMSLIKQLL
jgi:predicted transport protein